MGEQQGRERLTWRGAAIGALAAAGVLGCGVWGAAVARTDASGQVVDGQEVAGYVGSEVMIPMRDGVKLHAMVWRPKAARGPLPILIQRSPYGFSVDSFRHSADGQFKELMADGFIFVLEDIRGRFGSEGDFVMLRPKKTTATGIDETTDAWDTTDWLVKHVGANNGKVGIFGISYGGWTTAMAAANPHPAVKAVSVQASPQDMWKGDDFHHNGAFRLDYGWEYAATLETDGRTLKPFSFGKDDPYGWFLKQGRLADLDTASLGQTLPTWRNFVDHPDYDGFWKAQATTSQMGLTPTVPDLIVAGWWDQEDFYGPLEIYKAQAPHDVHGFNHLVIGPWNHGGWARGDGRRYGPYDLGSETAVWFRQKVQLPWFRYWLKGEGKLDQPGALVFETGSNQWRRLDRWPAAAGAATRSLYFRAGGRLSFDPPKAGEAADRFTSDPANPVPYRARPIAPLMAEGSTWPVWLADDQAPFSRRPDVLTYRTEPLAADVAIGGDVAAKLFASTTGTDADWVVKLIDLYPDDASVPAEVRGRGLIIADEAFRGRYREGFETPRPLKAGKVLDYAIDLHGASHVFKAGHRIVVQVQSTWFPLIDRNPQTFVPNIFKAPASAYKAQTHAVWHAPGQASALEVSLVR